uniref:Uncharacterized protein n=1 Tax=Calcidiscus leptoporus TaxID=127549 RepID=A0A7S0P6J9_9EUKA|mmetsp:Transcript_7610/g.17786  ORF Transcript_7610/g.17786 Transcript_7610/m.17786 type:complete len:466 (+) Transcript_7610:156-1553(+)
MATIPENIEGLPESERETAFSVLNVIEVCAVGALIVLVGMACMYVARISTRGRGLAVLRQVLGIVLVLWAVGTLLAHPAPWEVASFAFRLRSNEHDFVCWLSTLMVQGFFEPCALLLIAGLIRRRSRLAELQPAYGLIGRAMLLSAPFLLIQAVVVALGEFEAENTLLRPRPVEREDADEANRDAAGSGETAGLLGWWRDEGCAVSIASVIVEAVFVLPFLVAWSLACLRLVRLLRNTKIKRRLQRLHLTFTLMPLMLLCLRISRLIFPSRFEVTRRLAHDFELILVILGSAVCTHSLIWRPVREWSKARPGPIEPAIAELGLCEAQRRASPQPLPPPNGVEPVGVQMNCVGGAMLTSSVPQESPPAVVGTGRAERVVASERAGVCAPALSGLAETPSNATLSQTGTASGHSETPPSNRPSARGSSVHAERPTQTDSSSGADSGSDASSGSDEEGALAPPSRERV